jgi:phosphate transport system substrate-binding protein
MSIRFHHRAARVLGSAAVALALLVPLSAVLAADMTLREAGSTLLYPLFQRWVPDYVTANPGTNISTAATGSGDGIAQAIAGHVHIGASDAYMSDEQVERNRGILNIPLAIAAQTVNYNIPDLNGSGLKLDGPTLADIYSGKITMWDDPAIVAMNQGVKLPHQGIVPIHRADPSGDTFVFTQFLDFASQSWETRYRFGTEVAWPNVPAAKTATGNAGMVQTLGATPYSVGYVGISFHDDIAKAGLGTAMLKSQDGDFLLPTAETVSEAASQLDQRTPPDERLSLAFAPGPGSYPLVNYEYAIVAAKQPDAATAAAVRSFLLWSIALDGGNASKYLDAVGFIPLPNFIRALSEAQIRRIQ